ncbi:hypothetical protein [Loktanella sp. S4079]|uniref:hypothetical protein n=1 Tax=Loktanella sp. S4079 TaxID=579483 RepID=UPI0005FA3204|nr:hypothetical protein [Loktanella sp. S4079]KJZ18874.1 hypothetical protein TW80_12400 [Loktanella sp. S4079]
MKRRNIFLVSLFGGLAFTDAFHPWPYGWSGLPELTERLFEASVFAVLMALIGPKGYENLLMQGAGGPRIAKDD